MCAVTTSEQQHNTGPSPKPVWGSPQPSPQRWGLRQTAAAVGVAAVIAALGGAAIYAAADGSRAMGGPGQPFGPGHAAPGGPGQMGPGGPGQIGPGGPAPAPMMFGAGPDTPSVHGEFVVTDASGGYTTVVTQTGAVTALSTTSVTVRSADGYVETYAMPAGSPSAPFAVGDQVIVRATRDGQTPTITSIATPEPAPGQR